MLFAANAISAGTAETAVPQKSTTLVRIAVEPLAEFFAESPKIRGARPMFQRQVQNVATARMDIGTAQKNPGTALSN